MHSPEIQTDPADLPLAEADLVGVLSRLCAFARVHAHAFAIPALANLLMQGLVC